MLLNYPVLRNKFNNFWLAEVEEKKQNIEIENIEQCTV